jgi:signal transduction histidine kinase
VIFNRAEFSLQHLLRHGLQAALFNFGLGGLLLLSSGSTRGWDRTLVYSQAIGLSIWAIIDIGRLLLLKPGEQGWPSWGRALPLLVVGVVGGWSIGSLLGDLYCDCSTWSLLTRSPDKLRTTITLTLAASTVAIYYFYSRGAALAQREKLAAAERDATLARLTLLQSQLEPHMLFNTLANLRVLIALDPPRAQAMLDRLIAFLRATLSASRSSAHSLAAEFERLDDYLELMAVRMGARLDARLSLPEDLRALPVPPLLLQPLVENAVKHGLEPQVEGGRIDIAAQREGDTLCLTVRDTGAGLHDAPAPEACTAFGLQQVRERLHALYGARASFTIEAAADAEGGTLARITLPLSTHGTDRADR